MEFIIASPEIRDDPHLRRLVEATREPLEDILGRSAPVGKATWTYLLDRGRARLDLTLADLSLPEGRVRSFSPDDLERGDWSQDRFRSLWVDVLQARLDGIVRSLQTTLGVGSGR